MSAPAMATPSEWRARGRALDLADGRIFTVDIVPSSSLAPRADPLLILHGFPAASWSFSGIADLLARTRRIVLFDFPGFGFSSKPDDAAYSVFEHADVALAVARALELPRVHVWAHDMGGSVATELIARRERGLLPFEMASLVLMNSGVFGELSRPTLGQRVLMSAAGPLFSSLIGWNKRVFLSQLRGTFGRQPAPDVLDSLWTILESDGGLSRLSATLRFMRERREFRRRWIGALQRIDLPVLVAWGAGDPVTPMASGERLARETPGAELVTWPDLGHYPQMEDPAQVAAVVGAFLTRTDGRAAAIGR